MNEVAIWSPQQRGELYRDAYEALDWKLGEPGIVEKDYWVCWILAHPFDLKGHRDHIIFKGGTSLSKVFGAIRRFSEDIDLSIHRQALGFGDERDPVRAISGKQRQKRIAELGIACEEFLQNELLPELNASIEAVLGPSTDSDWALNVDDRDRQTRCGSRPTMKSFFGFFDGIMRPWRACFLRIRPISTRLF